jgi:hypothetical protein
MTNGSHLVTVFLIQIRICWTSGSGSVHYYFYGT